MQKKHSVLKMCLVGAVILGMKMSVGLAEDVIVEDMVGGYTYNCVLLQDKTMQCWGGNMNGQLGIGTVSDWELNPIVVQNLSNVKKIVKGWGHNCSILADDTIKCWGLNNYGQLGDRTTTEKTTPVTSFDGQTVKDVAISESGRTCVILSDNTVKCWGLNNYGQLGNGIITSDSKSHEITPVSVFGLQNVSQLSLGSYHSCAVLLDGTLKCWGRNDKGQLGDKTTTDRTTPVLVSGISNTVKVQTGSTHTCVLLGDKTVRCWGQNDKGQLGNGNFIDNPSPTLVSNLQNVVDIEAGGSHTCALLEDKTVKCWGLNYGQVGDGTTTNRNTPVLISGLQNIQKIMAAGYHTCAVDNNGNVKCWGYNGRGGLGDGTQETRLVPTPMTLGFKFASTQTAPACTESDWTSAIAPETCPSTEEQTKTWMKTGTCEGGVTHPETEIVSCTYNVPVCTESNWTSSIAPSVCPESGEQVKTWTKTGTCDGGVTYPETETLSCTYMPPSTSLWQKISETVIYFLGNVGIGTSNPQEKLDVNGNVKVSGNLNLSGDILPEGDICIGKCD